MRTWITWEQTPWHWGTRSAWTKWASVNLKMRLRLPVNIFSVKCKVVDRAVNRTFPSHWIIFAFIIYQIFRFSCGHSTQGSWLVIFLQVKIFDPKLTQQKLTGKLPLKSYVNDLLVILAQTWSKIDQFQPINRVSAWFFFISMESQQYENSGSCLFKSEYKLKPFTVASPGKRVLYHLVLIIFPDSNIFL